MISDVRGNEIPKRCSAVAGHDRFGDIFEGAGHHGNDLHSDVLV